MPTMASYINRFKLHLERNDIEEDKLHNHQKKAHKLLLEGFNFSAFVPTGFGKTEDGLAALGYALYCNLVAVYLVPRVMLLHQKARLLKTFFKGIARVIIIQGDLKPHPRELRNPWGKLIIVATFESFRAFLFSIQKRKYFNRKTNIFGSVVIDEVHMLGDRTHGPALETMLYKLHKEHDSQFCFLSGSFEKTSADWWCKRFNCKLEYMSHERDFYCWNIYAEYPTFKWKDNKIKEICNEFLDFHIARDIQDSAEIRPGKMVIFARSRKKSEIYCNNVKNSLKSRRPKYKEHFKCSFIHAGMSLEERKQVFDDFNSDEGLDSFFVQQ
ncbi:MAG: DEAD/DEAH box helicase [Candidatus Helarchaeota archaeon]|nr:DEAD/DEAH box helicase [Candidatus Helarchaeota archaeon]